MDYIFVRDVIISKDFPVKFAVTDLPCLYFEEIEQVLKCNLADLTIILTQYEVK